MLQCTAMREQTHCRLCSSGGEHHTKCAPTVMSTIRDHLASSNEKASYTNDLWCKREWGMVREKTVRWVAQPKNLRLEIETSWYQCTQFGNESALENLSVHLTVVLHSPHYLDSEIQMWMFTVIEVTAKRGRIAQSYVTFMITDTTNHCRSWVQDSYFTDLLFLPLSSQPVSSDTTFYSTKFNN